MELKFNFNEKIKKERKLFIFICYVNTLVLSPFFYFGNVLLEFPNLDFWDE